MKKFIQICLVFILVFVLLQVVAGPSMDVTDKLSSSMLQSTSFIGDEPVQDSQMAACMGAKGVVCNKVGWNT